MTEFLVAIISICIGSAAITLGIGVAGLILYVLYARVRYRTSKWKDKWH